MSGISGFSNFKYDYLTDKGKFSLVLDDMARAIRHRGIHFSNSFLNSYVGLNLRHKIANNKNNKPYTVAFGDYIIISDSEIYNPLELKAKLIESGYKFKTDEEAELLLASYIIFGNECAKEINGVFAFAIWDGTKKCFFVCRDRLGIKPLYYTIFEDNFIFASEIKALFCFPGFAPRLDNNGLADLLGVLPSHAEGDGVFKDVKELKFGCYGIYNSSGFNEKKYWSLECKENSLKYNDAVDQAKFLVTDAVRRQLKPEDGVCSFLSGGIDSSIVTGLAAQEFSYEGKTLDTFAFEYEDNEKFFKSNSFQSDLDKKWALEVSNIFKTNHTILLCSNEDLADTLYDAVDARDLPGMADVDSSLLYFCKIVSKTHNVALTGECADELFAGYPWYHSSDPLKSNSFPWFRNTDFRREMFSKELIDNLNLDEYVQKQYDNTINECPTLPGESVEASKRRQLAFLNMKWFMCCLVDRMDRMAAFSGFAGRVPYADYRIAEFLWNLPWDIKFTGQPKSLLRDAFSNFMPDELVNRKKSPFPKTYNPVYEEIITKRLEDVVNDNNAPIQQFINKKKVLEFLEMSTDYGKPWYGQLMAGPQLKAFILQINYWLKKYKVEIL